MGGAHNNASHYFDKHLENYENRGMDEKCETDEILWIGMVNSLLESGYVCECDSKDELDAEDEITDWYETIDQNWQSYDICVAAIDMNSDSYVMFPCRRDAFETLCGYTRKVGYRIDPACTM